MKNEMRKKEKDMLYLVVCALHNIKPQAEKVEKMDFEELYNFCKFHSLVAITYDALELLGDMNFDENKACILKKWKEQRDKSFRKNLMLDSARKKLFMYLDKNNIWYMPLKGVILKDLYPKQEMRQMADNDILFDAKYEEIVKDYFVREGYDVILYRKRNHDVYYKKPIYNFEMHMSLFDAKVDELGVEYYGDVRKKLLSKHSGEELAFTDEDFYIYFVVHAFKHFDESGTGIRYFVDCYVYIINKQLDWEYIEQELKKIGIFGFEKVFRSAALKIFDNVESVENLNDEEYKLICESMSSGTYGCVEKRYENILKKKQGNNDKINKKTKTKYFLERLFPNMSFYKKYYPTVYKTKILIPFCMIFRVVRGVLFRRRKLVKEVKMVWKVGK